MTQHHLLVIGESERLRDVLQSALAGDNYRVTSITSAFSDVRTLAALRPDLLIVDWLLGCEDHGLQVLQILQLCQPLNTLPTIVCSAPIGLVREIERWLRGSHIQFLLKPFGLAELHRVLQGALSPIEAEPAVTEDATDGRLPGEHDAEHWAAASPRMLTARRGEWEWHAPYAPVEAPTEAPLTDGTAAVGG